MDPEQPGADEDPIDEHPFVERFKRAGEATARGYFTRPVTTLVDKDGKKYETAIGQTEIPPFGDPSRVEVILKSRRNQVIIVSAGMLLTAAGLVYAKRNRSQRQKMPARESSYKRKPKGDGKLP